MTKTRPDPHPFRRTSRKLLRLGIPIVLAGGLAVVMLLPSGPVEPLRAEEQTSDLTKFGPDRTLSLTACSWTPSPQGKGGELEVAGTTNFPTGSRIRIDIRSRGRSLETHEARSDGGRFELKVLGKGHVLAGFYNVVATFALEEQSREIQESLHFQPRRLVARRPLELPTTVTGPEGAIQTRLRTLFGAVNAQPRDRLALARLDQEAMALGKELWIANQKIALKKLRLAIEEAGRPKFRRQSFERLLIEAHVLAGL